MGLSGCSCLCGLRTAFDDVHLQQSGKRHAVARTIATRLTHNEMHAFGLVVQGRCYPGTDSRMRNECVSNRLGAGRYMYSDTHGAVYSIDGRRKTNIEQVDCFETMIT